MLRSPSYARPVRRVPTLFVVVPHFVEIVLVELAHKAREVAMLEVFWENRFGESFVLSRKLGDRKQRQPGPH